MFIGRDRELKVIERLYQSEKFEYLVMYGRRRVGKTELLIEFAKKHHVCFYSAIEKKSNLSGFGREVLNFFGEKSDISFDNWRASFDYISNHGSAGEKIVIIIDEFPYIAAEEPEVKSILQHTIDHEWKNKNIFLILCGSSVSFMINDVMGKKAPLYGRNTSVLEMKPFEYKTISDFFPDYSAEDKMITYGILGGVPYYMMQFSDRLSIKENLVEKIIESSAVLREEPQTLLRAEVREPSKYNSIIEAVSRGATRLSEISTKTGMEATSVSVYLRNLQEMRIIEKITPCGEKESGKKSQYIITDNFFSFWYRYIFGNKTKIDMMDPDDFAEDIWKTISDYMGLKFEKICQQYLYNEARNGNLPFVPSQLGKWWGTNNKTRKPEDMDILGIDGDKYIFCECKFKNELFDLNEIRDLLDASMIFSKAKDKYYYIFVKSDYTEAAKKEAEKYNMRLLTIEDMF
jgi:AAA+ ATPase superfamily predicted ATPase